MLLNEFQQTTYKKSLWKSLIRNRYNGIPKHQTGKEHKQVQEFIRYKA